MFPGMGYGYGYGYGYRIDPTMMLLIPAILLTLYAQYKVSSTTNRYFNVRCDRGYTGEEVARRILDSNGLYNVRIEMVRGRLSDHYDPRSNVVRLSEDVYSRTSITSISVAAHECGHAIQHQNSYIPLTLRSALVPVANFGSSLSLPLIIIGFSMGYVEFLIDLGILLFGAAVLFQIITLPVEFNASRRAVIKLGETGILMNDELRLSKKVLNAAALTYVAAAAASILQLLRLILLFRGGRNRD